MESFEALPIPRREIALPGGRYRVYKEGGEFVTVEAINAMEAFKASGLPQALRIQRDSIYLNNVIDAALLAATPPPSAEHSPAPPAEAAVPDAPPAAEPQKAEPAADQALSGAEVDKLLGQGGAGAAT